MRLAKTLLPLALLASAVGCEWLRKMGVERDSGTTVSTGPVKDVTAAELVGYLNRQAGYLQAVRYSDVYIDVYAGKEHYTLGDSTLVCAKPRNFRLVGGKRVLGDLVDLGSNDREFWMYSRYPEPAYVFCSHADFQKGQGQLPFPFDPDWALQALGMATYDPTLPFRAETDQRHGVHTLTVDTTTPQGVPVKRTVIFDPRAGGNKPHVRQFTVTDAANKTIATAEVKEVTTVPVGTDPLTGKPAYAEVPTRVVLEWPQQPFKMDLRLHSPKVNERFDRPADAELFRKPTIDGVRPVNLAEAPQFTPSSFRGAAPTDRPRRGR